MNIVTADEVFFFWIRLASLFRIVDTLLDKLPLMPRRTLFLRTVVASLRLGIIISIGVTVSLCTLEHGDSYPQYITFIVASNGHLVTQSSQEHLPLPLPSPSTLPPVRPKLKSHVSGVYNAGDAQGRDAGLVAKITQEESGTGYLLH